MAYSMVLPLLFAALASLDVARPGDVPHPMTRAQCGAAEVVIEAEIIRGGTTSVFSTAEPTPAIGRDRLGLARGWINEAPSLASLIKFDGSRPLGSALACPRVLDRLKSVKAPVSAEADSRSRTTYLIKVGAPVVNDAGNEAIVYVSSLSSTGGSERLLFLKRASAGPWKRAGEKLLRQS